MSDATTAPGKLPERDLVTLIRMNLKSYTMVIALLLIWLLFGAMTNWLFLSPRNLSNLFRQMSIISFLATGMVLVIVAGNIDLSVGSVTGFVSAVTAYIQVDIMPDLLPKIFHGLVEPQLGVVSTIISVVSALLVGLLVGIWQGAIIAYLRVPAFIVTLGGMLIFRGGVLAVTQGRTITPIEDPLRLIAQGYVSDTLGLIIAAVVVVLIFLGIMRGRSRKREYGFALPKLQRDLVRAFFFSAVVVAYVVVMNLYRGVQNPVLLLAVIAVIITYVAKNTRFGRYVYALGGNREATRLSGINISQNVFLVHVLIGVLCGVAGVVLTGYVAAGTTGGGTNYELDTIASCVIGGTSLMGGEGTIFGAIIGSVIMASLVNGMSVMNMEFFWQYIVRGLVLIFAVYIDVVSKRAR
jgi:D-xylose transport system permease protein